VPAQVDLPGRWVSLWSTAAASEATDFVREMRYTLPMSQQKLPLDPLISAHDSNEYFNSISHLIGAILSISALAVLVTLAAIDHKPGHVIGFAIYGTSLFLSFLFSCLLHFFLLFGKYLRVFGVLDHNAIYLLIAGTYTPFCLTIFSGATGWVNRLSIEGGRSEWQLRGGERGRSIRVKKYKSVRV
jgi:predicted membrane channel-forming protein YqfA (hemolysin III family)